MAIEFARATKVINVTAPQTSVFLQDLINAIRDYEDNDVNMDLARIANATGKQSLGGGVLVGITMELINDWRIAFSGWTGPDTQSVSVGGGNLVATNQYNNNPILPTEYTQVSIQSSSSATISQLEIINLQHMIESQRGEHAGFGDVYYWDPQNGNDTNNGSTPDSATATWSAAEGLCTDGGDDIVFMSMPSINGYTTSEQIVFTKNAVHLRGPGPLFVVKPSGVPTAVFFSGVNRSTMSSLRISANWLSTSGGTHFDGNGISISGCEQIHVTNTHIYDTPKHGIHIDGGEHIDVQHCEMARAGGHGIALLDDAKECIFKDNIARSCEGDGFHISGNEGHDIRFYQNVAHSCGGYGAAFWGASAIYADSENFAFNCASGFILDRSVDAGILPRDQNIQAANTRYLIEGQREHHTSYGNIFYWAPTNGDDLNDGKDLTNAVKTFSRAHDLVTDSNHDVIVCQPDFTGGATNAQENIEISKRYTFLRGPGRDFKILGSGTGTPTVTISAEGVELHGMQIETPSGTPQVAIRCTASFPLFDNVWVNRVASGIYLENASYAMANNLWVENTDTHGIIVGSGTKESRFNKVSLHNCTSDAFRIEADTKDILVDHLVAYSNGNGVNILLGATDITLGSDFHVFDNTIDVINSGVSTHIHNAYVASGVWNHQVPADPVAGSFAEKIGKKLLTFIKFMGAK